ncbi:ABC transporter substrate-binding protein [Vulgatibacter incomptus]|uniref:Dipeptide-binding ABC transporter, periplasmic substrate-binding component n=1 Tax=Vulgatibacter incomptus TaxID=1391653 RepID=A0A0K1PFE3_9BACT|nr:ABC transporter substrate-binding protein [Vulgatibacter incomptus]AKU92156.1 Dipeptide-binding ABC transporter, periplasmic substrate-binding component [Vulgatibacter incomptus]
MIVLAIDAPPETLDRRMALGLNAMRIAQLVTPGLTRIDERGEAVPDLAESFEAEGARKWIFHLRPGLAFSDGTPLSAEDVVATFRSVLDPAVGSPHRSAYGYVESVEAPDPATVVFRLSRPFGAMPVDGTLGILPARLAGPEHRDELRLRPIGAGPFVVSRWDGADDLRLAPNPRYFGGAPVVSLEVRTVRDETTRILELRKGRVDVLLGSLSAPLLPALRGEPRLQVKVGPGAGVSYLMFNMTDPTVGRREVREAIALALDREALARFKLKGAAQVADTLFREDHWAYDAGVGRRSRDLGRAKALLDEAGFREPADGGPRLTLTLKLSTDRFRRSLALAMASQLAEAGIRLELQPLEWGTFLGDVKRGNFQVASLKWPAVVDPDLLRLAYHSASIPSEASAWGGGNRMRYRNAELDALLDRGREEVDPLERRAAYAAAQRILARDLPAIPLLHEDAVGVIAKTVEGVEVDPQGSLRSLARARRIVR